MTRTTEDRSTLRRSSIRKKKVSKICYTADNWRKRYKQPAKTVILWQHLNKIKTIITSTQCDICTVLIMTDASQADATRGYVRWCGDGAQAGQTDQQASTEQVLQQGSESDRTASRLSDQRCRRLNNCKHTAALQLMWLRKRKTKCERYWLTHIMPSTLNPLDSKGIYSDTSNNTKLVYWPLMGGLLHLVQQGWAWAGYGPAQSPPRCTKCNSPPINGQCTNHCIATLWSDALRF